MKSEEFESFIYGIGFAAVGAMCLMGYAGRKKNPLSLNPSKYRPRRTVEDECPPCEGNGTLETGDVCRKCGGSGFLRRDPKLISSLEDLWRRK